MSEFYSNLINLLKTNNDYVSEDGELLKARVYKDAMTMEPSLLSLLMSEDSVKDRFFAKVNETLIFDKKEFTWLIDSKKFLPDSYTAYSNKIGLSHNGQAISSNNDVVLDFPYKDGVLAGGQDKEDAAREEIIYHEKLAHEEITNLLSPKVLSNAKRYTEDGVEEDITFDEDDNLIIKGNNLIALSSLLERYENKVKCIFIDPPYFFVDNKPSDTFSYNSKFKLSSWLVFMKNRIQLANKLLNEYGILFITISDEGAHYLKVMCDDIFGMSNFIADVTWESRTSVSSDGLMSSNSNHVLVYAKDINNITKNDFRLALDKESFKYDDGDGKGPYRIEPFDAPEVRENLEYDIVNPNTGVVFTPPTGRHWRTEEHKYKQLLKDGYIKFGMSGEAKPQLKAYYSEVSESGKGKTSTTIWSIDSTRSILWQETNTNTSATKHQRELFEKSVFTNPKPEELLKRIIELSTQKEDIVLDFFMGSATTQAVAHKMNRQYIGIEQMDYINDVSVERLKKVIAGEQGGISKEVNWQGGGSFVYYELLENNQKLLDLVRNAREANIQKIKQAVYADERIIPYINTKDLKKVEEEFNALNLDDKKQALIDLIDKNKLYVPYSSINDENFDVSEEDKRFSESFYEGGGIDE